jgi:hypothetical protein
MSQTNNLLAERYGRKPTKVRPLTALLIAVAVLGFFGFAIYASFIGKGLASVEVTNYQNVDANHIAADFTALTGSQPASCVFKAYDDAGSVVGFSEVAIPANNSDSRVLRIVVKTVVPASVLKADSCSVK